MTSGWSMFIVLISLFNILDCVWLLRWTAKPNRATEKIGGGADTGHVWDKDLREYNNPQTPQSKDSPTPKPATPPPVAKPVPPWNLPAGSPDPAIAPFDAAKAKEHQAAWAKHLGVPVVLANSIGMKFMLIPPGEFDMGSTEAEAAKLQGEARAMHVHEWHIQFLPSESPKHRVRITKPFYLGRYEVTQAEYERLERGNPSRFQGDPWESAELRGLAGSPLRLFLLLFLLLGLSGFLVSVRQPARVGWFIFGHICLIVLTSQLGVIAHK